MTRLIAAVYTGVGRSGAFIDRMTSRRLRRQHRAVNPVTEDSGAHPAGTAVAKRPPATAPTAPTDSGTTIRGDRPITLEGAIGAAELVSVLRDYGLRMTDIARAANVKRQSVHRWAEQQRSPDAAYHIRLDLLRNTVLALADVLGPVAVGQWLRLPQAALNDYTPLQAIGAGHGGGVPAYAQVVAATFTMAADCAPDRRWRSRRPSANATGAPQAASDQDRGAAR
jgi:hypothetical protein